MATDTHTNDIPLAVEVIVDPLHRLRDTSCPEMVLMWLQSTHRIRKRNGFLRHSGPGLRLTPRQSTLGKPSRSKYQRLALFRMYYLIIHSDAYKPLAAPLAVDSDAQRAFFDTWFTAHLDERPFAFTAKKPTHATTDLPARTFKSLAKRGAAEALVELWREVRATLADHPSEQGPPRVARATLPFAAFLEPASRRSATPHRKPLTFAERKKIGIAPELSGTLIDVLKLDDGQWDEAWCRLVAPDAPYPPLADAPSGNIQPTPGAPSDFESSPTPEQLFDWLYGAPRHHPGYATFLLTASDAWVYALRAQKRGEEINQSLHHMAQTTEDGGHLLDAVNQHLDEGRAAVMLSDEPRLIPRFATSQTLLPAHLQLQGNSTSSHVLWSGPTDVSFWLTDPAGRTRRLAATRPEGQPIRVDLTFLPGLSVLWVQPGSQLSWDPHHPSSVIGLQHSAW